MIQTCVLTYGALQMQTTYLLTYFLSPETGASHLVPETMTHLTGKEYQQKNKDGFQF